MSDCTPTTEYVRTAYASLWQPKGYVVDERFAEFDRWLAEHEDQIRKRERAETAKVLRNWSRHLMGYKEEE